MFIYSMSSFYKIPMQAPPPEPPQDKLYDPNRTKNIWNCLKKGQKDFPINPNLADLSMGRTNKMTPARNPKPWCCSPSGMLDGQLAWGAIWTKKCWFSIVNIDVWARNLVFRLDETRASVTKYCFFWSKQVRELRAPFMDILFHPPGPLQCKHCFGKNVGCLLIFANIGPVGRPCCYPVGSVSQSIPM